MTIHNKVERNKRGLFRCVCVRASFFFFSFFFFFSLAPISLPARFGGTLVLMNFFLVFSPCFSLVFFFSFLFKRSSAFATTLALCIVVKWCNWCANHTIRTTGTPCA